MYAQLCKLLSEEAPNFESPNSPCTFKVLLLNKCKTEFENRALASQIYPDDAILSSEDEERKQNAKRKMLGNIKFIGELGKLEILAEGILHKCVHQLLQTTHRKPLAEDLECLCQIMKTCGHILDTDKGSKLMKQYFTRMQLIAENTELPSRIRFMLRDIIELRKDKWVPRKATHTGGPMPMNQLCIEDNEPSNSFRNSDRRHNVNQELFRRPLNTRTGFDDMMGGSTLALLHTGPLHHSDKFNSYNGFHSGGYRQNSRQQNQQPFYQQNRFNNGSNNNNSAGKDLAPRFKKMMIHQPAASNLEEISLRPQSNSMVFKPLNTTKPQHVMPPVNNHNNMPTPHPVKENVVVLKPAPVEKTKNNKKEKGPSKDEILKKVSTLAEELLKERQVESAVSAWKEHKVPERLNTEALVTVLNATLDKQADHELVLDLVAELKLENIISSIQVLDCIRNLVNSMGEKEAAVPKIHSMVANLAALAVTKNMITLMDIAEMSEGGNHYPLFMLTLQNLHRSLGKQELTTLFNQSKVNLLQTLPQGDRSKERLSELLDDRNLGFLCPLLRIQAELWKQLEADQNPTALYKWIKDNLDPAHHTNTGFISALVTVIVKYVHQEVTGTDKRQEREQAFLEKYKPVLETFLNNRIDLQVVAVYTLQTFCFSLDFPKGMLLRWFVSLYNLEIIDEDAFLKWREDITDAYPGKGQALFQVNSWLTWLETVSSEEEDDDDD